MKKPYLRPTIRLKRTSGDIITESGVFEEQDDIGDWFLE